MPNASVTVTNVDSNVAGRATTNAEGAYYIPFQIGRHVSDYGQGAGVQAVRSAGIALEIGQTPRSNVTLEVGNAADAIEVTAAAADSCDR